MIIFRSKERVRKLERLTMSIGNAFYYSDNGNPILPIEMLDTPKVREVLKRLSEYEDIGLMPDVIKYRLEAQSVIKGEHTLEDDSYNLNCPKCNSFVGLYENEDGEGVYKYNVAFNYCPECGQKLKQPLG